jgi:predicted molibdopterin-dependent oxidoreductase YjgC
MKLYTLVAPVTPIPGQSAEELHHEITALTGLYNETCDHEGCRMGRVKNRAPFSDRPVTFAAVAPTEVPVFDQAHPFSLTVGPILHHNGSMTLWSDNNTSVVGQGYVTINPIDALKAGIAAGSAAKVSSSAGSVTLPAQLSDIVQAGALFVPSHFRESQAGLLLKGSANTIAVKLEKA